MLPTNAEVVLLVHLQIPIVSNDMNVFDLVDILRSEEKDYVLLWNSEKHKVEGIHLMVDFINPVLSTDLKNYYASKIIR